MSEMSSTQKRGFRLPWAAERSAEEAGTAVLETDGIDPKRLAEIRASHGDELGEGPSHRSDPTTDAVPAASDVPTEAA